MASRNKMVCRKHHHDGDPNKLQPSLAQLVGDFCFNPKVEVQDLIEMKYNEKKVHK